MIFSSYQLLCRQTGASTCHTQPVSSDRRSMSSQSQGPDFFTFSKENTYDFVMMAKFVNILLLPSKTRTVRQEKSPRLTPGGFCVYKKSECPPNALQYRLTENLRLVRSFSHYLLFLFALCKFTSVMFIIY
uniref:Secreted protein n=1 Tax=Panagrellus redivivus TaxID=6233 RepID=A0A7E4VD67_PANRE